MSNEENKNNLKPEDENIKQQQEQTESEETNEEEEGTKKTLQTVSQGDSNN